VRRREQRGKIDWLWKAGNHGGIEQEGAEGGGGRNLGRGNGSGNEGGVALVCDNLGYGLLDC